MKRIGADRTQNVATFLEVLKENQAKVLRGIFRIQTNDESNSVRSKMIYVKILGSGVKVMQKAKLASAASNIDDFFATKHVTIDIEAHDDSDFDVFKPTPIVKQLLSAGGAHKPTFVKLGATDDYLKISDL